MIQEIIKKLESGEATREECFEVLESYKGPMYYEVRAIIEILRGME